MKLKFQANKEGQKLDLAEKIISGLYARAQGYNAKQHIKTYHEEMVKRGVIVSFLNSTDRFKNFPPKDHSIRSSGTKWKKGDTIEFISEVAKSKGVEFAPKRTVVSVQYLILDKSNVEENGYQILISNNKKDWAPMGEKAKAMLANKDGFKSVKDLFNYFLPADSKDGIYKGKLVHWTYLSYPVALEAKDSTEENLEA